MKSESGTLDVRHLGAPDAPDAAQAHGPASTPPGTRRATRPRVTPPGLSRRVPTVLVVDPDPESRAATRAVLEAAGLDPLPLGGAADAQLVVRYLRGPLDLILVEGRLGDTTGPDLARQLMADRPEARALVMGGPEPERGWAWVDKPFTGPELVAAVEAVLSKPRV